MRRFLAEVRALAYRRAGWALGGTAVAAAGGALLVVVLGAAAWPAAGWRTLALTGALVGGSALALAIGRTRRAFARDEALAQLVRARIPALGDDLWSALELGRELPRLDAEGRLSGELVRALHANVEARLAEVQPAPRAQVDRAVRGGVGLDRIG